MLDHARDAIAFLDGADADSLRRDRKTRAAVLNAVITVGEASTKLSERLKAATPGVDWRGIKSMRNILVHDYRSVDPSLLVQVVEDDLPTLITQLEALLRQDPQQ